MASTNERHVHDVLKKDALSEARREMDSVPMPCEFTLCFECATITGHLLFMACGLERVYENN